MDREWLRIFAVVALGMLLPQLVVGIGSRQHTLQTEPAETTRPAESVAHQNTEEMTFAQISAQPVFIPVVTGENQVEQMDLEEYIRGVVLAEMPASFEEEALKAQAVAARTYALRHQMRGDKHEDGAVCTQSSCCQAYLTDEDYLTKRGNRENWEKVAGAVEATAGLVLTYEGVLADTTYFACSGGRTEDAEAVWGADIPYLQAVDSPGEENAKAYEQTVFFTGERIMELLGRDLTGHPADWLGNVTQTDGGGVATIVIGGITYSGTQLRKLLGLNSTAFTVKAEEDGLSFTTRGKGHRVGMSQYGADAMAVLGSRFEEILAHYYPGTVIDKMENMG